MGNRQRSNFGRYVQADRLLEAVRSVHPFVRPVRDLSIAGSGKPLILFFYLQICIAHIFTCFSSSSYTNEKDPQLGRSPGPFVCIARRRTRSPPQLPDHRCRSLHPPHHPGPSTPSNIINYHVLVDPAIEHEPCVNVLVSRTLLNLEVS